GVSGSDRRWLNSSRRSSQLWLTRQRRNVRSGTPTDFESAAQDWMGTRPAQRMKMTMRHEQEQTEVTEREWNRAAQYWAMRGIPDFQFQISNWGTRKRAAPLPLERAERVCAAFGSDPAERVRGKGRGRRCGRETWGRVEWAI